MSSSKIVDIETPYHSSFSNVPGGGRGMIPVDDDDGRRCAPEFQQFLPPELQGIYWRDDFFDDDEDIVAVFDFDYDQIISFQTSTTVVTQLMMVGLMAQCLGIYVGVYGVVAVVVMYLMSLSPCLLHRQIGWEVMADHVAITYDGIRFVQDRRKRWWGLTMCDKEKHIKTVPFDTVANCDVTKPMGTLFLCIKQVLHVVHVDTVAPGIKGNLRELYIRGLKEPYKFKALVLAMKERRAHHHHYNLKYQAPS